MISIQAKQFHSQSLVWDAHVCFLLNPEPDLSELVRYKNNGFDFVSINIGVDMDAFDRVVQVLAGFRNYIKADPDQYLLANTVNDIRQAKESNRIAIAFDLDGSELLNGNLNMIPFYYDLGVRQMLLAYNKDNRASGAAWRDISA